MTRSVPEWIGRNDDQPAPERVKLRIVNAQRPSPGEPPICSLCGISIYDGQGIDIDHIIPLIDGGGNRESNLCAVHRKCHRIKSAREALARAQARGSQKRAYGYQGKPQPDCRGPE